MTMDGEYLSGAVFSIHLLSYPNGDVCLWNLLLLYYRVSNSGLCIPPVVSTTNYVACMYSGVFKVSIKIAVTSK